MHIASHLMIRSRDDRVLAPSPADRRRLARSVVEQSDADGLLAFRAADTHLHVLLLADPPTARQCGRRIMLSLHSSLSLRASFDPGYVVDVCEQRHLYNAFRYILRQEERHGLQLDPMGDASSLPDLLGMRCLGTAVAARVAEYLPRIRRVELESLLPPAGEVAMSALAESAAAAVGVGEVRGSSVPVRRARIAAVHAFGQLRSRELASLLGTTPRTIRRCRHAEASSELVVAIHRQMMRRAGLRSAGEALTVAGESWDGQTPP